jgi:hypothetical protein
MTTKVTIETHDWPASVTTNRNHDHRTDTSRTYGWSTETVFVPAHEKREFYLTNGLSISFEELPKDATGLPNDLVVPASAVTASSDAPNED